MAKKRSRMIQKLEDDLAYRLPQSHKLLSCIVLSREQAEQLVADWLELERQLGDR